MKFSFGGSSGNWWNKFAKNFQIGGEAGNVLTTATTGLRGITDNPSFNKLGNKIVDATPFSDEPGGWFKGGQLSDSSKKSYMNLSRQLSPLWEGGLSGTGGTFHQDLLPWMEDVGMKASHHLMGTAYPGYGEAGKGGGGAGGSAAVVSAETEDPSLINQGNWQAPGSIDSLLRREQMLNRGGLATDLTKSKRGRLNVANLA